MKMLSLTMLQAGVVLVALCTFAFLLYEPHLEGRNVDATWFEIYFNDPFLLGAYGASIFFFIVLHQTFVLLGNTKKDAFFTLHSVSTLRTIRYCLLALVVMLCGAIGYLFVFVRTHDDIAGGVAIGVFLLAMFAVGAVLAFLLENYVQKKL